MTLEKPKDLFAPAEAFLHGVRIHVETINRRTGLMSVQIIRDQDTADEAVDQAITKLGSLGVTEIEMADHPGASHILIGKVRLEEGSTPRDFIQKVSGGMDLNE